MRLLPFALFAALAFPAHAAAGGWTSLGSASSAVAGDGTATFGYVQGQDFVRLNARTLAARRTPLGLPGCRVRQMARGAALVDCPDRTVRLVSAAGVSQTVAATDGQREPATTGPVTVFGFGDRWLQRLYVNGYRELLQWHTGALRPAPAGGDRDLDAVDPEVLRSCGPGSTLDRRGNRQLALRLAPGGRGTVVLVDCRATRVTRLGRLTTRDHVQGQLGPNVATWTSRSTVGTVRLSTRRPTTYRIPGASPASREPVKAAHAAGRLLVSVLAPDGRTKLLTRRLP